MKNRLSRYWLPLCAEIWHKQTKGVLGPQPLLPEILKLGRPIESSNGLWPKLLD